MLLHLASRVTSGVGSLISPQLIPVVVGLLEAIVIMVAWEIIWLFFQQLCRSMSPKLGICWGGLLDGTLIPVWF